MQTGQHSAVGPLKAIGRLYLTEKDLRQSRAGPEQRALIRQRDSLPIIRILHDDLLRLRADVSVLPKCPLGRAIDYVLTLWPKLGSFIDHGEVEIKTNLSENAIRPTAVGRKN